MSSNQVSIINFLCFDEKEFVSAVGLEVNITRHENIRIKYYCEEEKQTLIRANGYILEFARWTQPIFALQGGAFFFLEHVVGDPSTWTYFFQHVLQPAWYYFGDGCMATRETWKHLESAGFSELKLRHIEAPFIFVIKPHIIGYAIK